MKAFMEWVFLIFTIICGLNFITRDTPEHRPHDIIGAFTFMAILILFHRLY